MKVYNEGSSEILDIDATDATEAAEMAHAREDDGSGNAGTYRVLSPWGWQRISVRSEITTTYHSRQMGRCEAPESDDEGGE